jgi:hypothetical protein
MGDLAADSAAAVPEPDEVLELQAARVPANSKAPARWKMVRLRSKVLNLLEANEE